MPSDGDLVARICSRDARAFEDLLARYEGRIRRHLARIVRAEAAAQDLAQEVFLRVWTHAGQWNGSGSFQAWLYRIATNLAFNHLRSVRRRREQPLPVAEAWSEEERDDLIPAWLIDDVTPDPDAIVEQAEERALLRRLVDDLPLEKREVLHLVHDMEMTIQDAAEELGIPPGTVKSRLHYAKRTLAREWQDTTTDREGY
jgi:RNA polymerase sigma-70 factor (ECF subfamily)